MLLPDLRVPSRRAGVGRWTTRRELRPGTPLRGRAGPSAPAGRSAARSSSSSRTCTGRMPRRATSCASSCATSATSGCSSSPPTARTSSIGGTRCARSSPSSSGSTASTASSSRHSGRRSSRTSCTASWASRPRPRSSRRCSPVPAATRSSPRSCSPPGRPVSPCHARLRDTLEDRIRELDLGRAARDPRRIGRRLARRSSAAGGGRRPDGGSADRGDPRGRRASPPPADLARRGTGLRVPPRARARGRVRGAAADRAHRPPRRLRPGARHRGPSWQPATPPRSPRRWRITGCGRTTSSARCRPPWPPGERRPRAPRSRRRGTSSSAPSSCGRRSTRQSRAGRARPDHDPRGGGRGGGSCRVTLDARSTSSDRRSRRSMPPSRRCAPGCSSTGSPGTSTSRATGSPA